METLIRLLLKINKNKVLVLMIEILQTMAGKLLDTYLPFVKEAVINAEQIGNFIKDNNVLENDILIELIGDKFGYVVTYNEIEMVRNTTYKGLGKNLIAYRLVKDRFKDEGKNFIPFIVNILIEIVVAKYLK